MARAKKIAEWALSVGLGGLFIYAGMVKLLRPDHFLVDIESHRLLPYRLAYLTALYLPALEVAAGAGLLWRFVRREASVILLALTMVFIVALAGAWVRGLDISCGCFGGSATKANYPFLIGRDILILVGLIVVAVLASAKNEMAVERKEPGRKEGE